MAVNLYVAYACAHAGRQDFETERFPAKINRFNQLRQERFLPFTDSEAYRLLKVATESFVVVNCGVALTSFQFEPADLDGGAAGSG